MQQQTEITERPKGGASTRGRKTQDEQEQGVNLAPVKKGISELVILYDKEKAAADDLSSAIKAVADKSGLMSTAIRKLVKARAGEKFKERRREVEQLALVFEACGEG